MDFLILSCFFIDQLLKSFGIAANPEDKIFALAKSQVELERENSRRGSILKLSEKALEKEQREKEHLQKEYNKGVLIRYVSMTYCWQSKIVSQTRQLLFLSLSIAQGQTGTSMSRATKADEIHQE